MQLPGCPGSPPAIFANPAPARCCAYIVPGKEKGADDGILAPVRAGDREEGDVRMGHVKKARFIGILAGGFLVAGGTGVAMAQGGISANLALSGTVMTLTVDELVGDSSSLFVGAEKVGDGESGVSKLRFGDATGTDVCLSAPLGNVPGVGEATFKLLVPGQNFGAENLLVGAKDIHGALTMYNPQIGIDANQVDERAPGGSWGLAATRMVVQQQVLQVTSVAADSLTIAGAKINVVTGDDGGC